MIFRKENGELIIINRLDYKNDKIYYEKLMDLMKEYKNVIVNEVKKEKGKQEFVKLDF